VTRAWHEAEQTYEQEGTGGGRDLSHGENLRKRIRMSRFYYLCDRSGFEGVWRGPRFISETESAMLNRRWSTTQVLWAALFVELT
jgi:hypothetical protein